MEKIEKRKLTTDEIWLINDFLKRAQYLNYAHFDFDSTYNSFYDKKTELERKKDYSFLAEYMKVLEGSTEKAKKVRISQKGFSIISYGSFEKYRYWNPVKEFFTSWNAFLGFVFAFIALSFSSANLYISCNNNKPPSRDTLILQQHLRLQEKCSAELTKPVVVYPKADSIPIKSNVIEKGH